MNWIDFSLNVMLLALVPFALAAYGGHLAAETIADERARFSAKTKFWLLCFLGVGIAVVSQYRNGQAEEARNKRTAVAQKQAEEAQAELSQSEKLNSERLLSLQGQLNRVLIHPRGAEQKIDALRLKEEIAAAVADKIKPQNPLPSAPALQLPPPTITIPEQPKCRGDSLASCGDQALLDWGRPLVAKVEAIVNDHMADLKKLDDIKSGRWINELLGVNDKTSRWLKAYSEAEEKATDRFRNCCAESAVAYHKELAQRVGGGNSDTQAYAWIENLMRPVESKEYKRARGEAGNILIILSDLHQLQFGLKRIQAQREVDKLGLR